MSTLTQFLSGKLKSQEFLSSGTFTVPAGITTVWVTMCGGGGSGGGWGASNGAAGGGAGAYCIQRPVSVTPGASVTVTIGAGGASVTSGDAGGSAQVGNDGGATSFGAVSVSGGGGGNRVVNNSGNIVFSGNHAGRGSALGGCGITTGFRVAGSIGGRSGMSGQQNLGGGAGGLFGDGGDARNAANAIAGAANSGAGGGGVTESSQNQFLSGAGGSGRCIVEWIA
jgi:hypothetical protein